MLARLKSRARSLKTETYALYLAARDPRTPWFARALVLLVVAYALSPIDLIPDFIPVLGYLDDLVIVPAGIALALTLIPPDAMAQAREKARNAAPDRRAGIMGAAVIVLIWILAIIICALFILKLLRTHL
jgi:uncharacterized membrane protein YkvA (DUF1232 family)